MTDAPAPPTDASTARLRVFSYAVAEKAATYVAIVDVIAAGADRFRLQPRPREIRRDLAATGLVLDDDELAAALDQLHAWGNLTRLFDPTAAETLAEFYGRRYLYQLTPEGIAAHEGIERVRQVGLDIGGRLSRVLLPRVHERLEAVRLAAAEGDAGRCYAALLDLFGNYGELADNASRYMGDLAVETCWPWPLPSWTWPHRWCAWRATRRWQRVRCSVSWQPLARSCATTGTSAPGAWPSATW